MDDRPIEPAHIRTRVAELVAAGYSPSTIRRAYTLLQLALEMAVDVVAASGARPSYRLPIIGCVPLSGTQTDPVASVRQWLTAEFPQPI